MNKNCPVNPKLEEEKRFKQFKKLSSPLIKFLNDNCNPHCTIIITTTTSELLSGQRGFVCEDYVKD